MTKEQFDIEFYNSVIEKLRKIMNFLFELDIKGKDNVPKEGPCILAGNHISFLDSVLVGTSLERPVHFMAKEELFKLKFVETVLSKLGAFPIIRSEKDMKAMRTSIRILKNNNILGIFPEGHRNRELAEFKPGIMKIAKACNVSVVPFGISGQYKLGGGITLRFGSAIKNFDRDDNDFYLREKVKELIY